jgi:hypothetical protein
MKQETLETLKRGIKQVLLTVFHPKDCESGASAGITLVRIVEENMPKEYVLKSYRNQMALTASSLFQ